jgi:penicillin-binding protein 1A
MIVDMLKTVVASGTGTSAKIKDQVVGGKTGTNSDQKGVFFSGITGYYSSALWIGHDNYKALSSKSTGSGAAAPLWQAYMSKIHDGLPKKEILDGSFRDYGLVKVETCAVSGQLATDACRNDAMGYGTVTDYWAEGTQPTQYCQMHTEQSVCPDSGMIASEYCPASERKGVVTIPYGHPLYNLIGTQYQGVLEEYLGVSNVYGSQICTLHSADTTYTGDPVQTTLPEQRIAAARQLITSAEDKLRELDPASEQYNAIVNAATRLQNLIDSGNASQEELTNAMTTLTRAMAGLY